MTKNDAVPITKLIQDEDFATSVAKEFKHRFKQYKKVDRCSI
jgi:hypothetical protein